MFTSIFELIWTIVAIPIIFYVIYRLSTISKQLEQISKHLNIQDDEIEKISNEEIERELEEKHKR
jgi:predicted membrane protein